MGFIRTRLDKIWPKVDFHDLDAIQLAAKAGDVLSQYRYGRSLLDAGTHTDVPLGREWLVQAAKQGFAPAQYWLSVLARFGYRGGAPIWAGPLWAAQAARSAWNARGTSHSPFHERLLAVSTRPGKIVFGERTKYPYSGWWDSHSVCAVQFSKDENGIAVLIQTLPVECSFDGKMNTGTSVTNFIEHLALSILVQLLLDGVDVNPATVRWYELWPAGRSIHPRGEVQRLTLTWDAHAERYRKPVWTRVTPDSVPFDVSHAIRTQLGYL
ncbi:sel1 repeat family protein [Paraburkholderia sp. JPY303]|uniref:sel1 repeat family protein n=1 Tax=Paraburkholderia atlantica TaxID=2654982 RepID=UPI001592269E|nr:sel1 repeat family protein [Paraburkholderia atlantica]NUY35894.1 sel1 repeat family protein [Paraburkholderia atlantica]